ncbi:MAG: glycosyltransferase family 1 protein [Gemmatimonadaceae bacterium]|nr:glycosyltransferase family 1 protein [Gemmatimonadaceae bacterium]
MPRPDAPRLLVCTDTWAPQVNGVTVVTSLSVAGLIARGWDCAVIAPAYPAGTPGVPSPVVESGGVTSIPSVAFPNYPDIRAAAPALLRVRDRIRRFRPDLIHCATEFIIGRMGMWAGRQADIPVVTSYHTDFARYAAAYGTPWLERPIRWAIRRFHARAVRTFTPGRSAVADLEALGIGHAQLWGRGVDTTLFHPSKRSEAWRQRLGLEGRVGILCVSRLAPEKGIDVILAAFARLREHIGPDRARLIIAGTGPEEAALRAAAPPDVVFLGTLDRERDLPALYASCDLFAFASLTETLGLVVLEAMACGLPVVATPALGVAETLRDARNGLAVPPRDPAAMAQALGHLVTHATVRAQLMHGALVTAQQFSWERELDQLDATYRQCARSAPPVRATRPERVALR